MSAFPVQVTVYMSSTFPFLPRLALLASLVLIALPASAGPIEAQAAFDRGDYIGAYKEWLPLADKGDALAQLHLGDLFAQGQGVTADDDAAFKWYQKAARQGNAAAE